MADHIDLCDGHAAGGADLWLIYEHRRRNRAEMLARASMAEMAHMNRVATAGELSASIAHEVNQPITGIVLKAGAALRWLPEGCPTPKRSVTF